MSTPTAAAPAQRSAWRGLREFFRHHGALAPAVRLLRRLPILGKVAVVASGFVAGALLLAMAHTHLLMQIDTDLQLHRQGARQLQALGLLRDAVHAQREAQAAQAAGAPPRAPQPTAMPAAEAWSRLAALHAERPLVDAAAWGRLKTQWDAVRAVAGSDAQARSGDLLQLSEAIAEHRLEIVWSSGLDREVNDSAHRMALSATRYLPALLDRLFDSTDLALGTLTPPAGGASAAQTLQAARDAHALARDAHRAFGRELARLQASGEAPRSLEDAAWRALQAAGSLLAQTERALGDEPRAAPGPIDAAARSALAELGALEASLLQNLEQSLQAAESAGRQRLLLLAAAVGLLLATGLYCLIGFHRVMAGGLKVLSSEVRRMAQGDLSARPTPRGHDEVAHALQSLGGSLAMLSDMFSTVRQGVSSVVQASGAIARGNGELAERTARSVQQLEQVVTSVNRYMDQLDQSARRVDEAAALVEVMRLEAARSRHNMDQLQTRMKDLQGKSQEIAAIVSMIDGIAFRTNVLALNASIEAAKAGETGRGFAVVAQEVRRLARRSADSARNIQDIVARSTEDIVQGAALADRTGEALRTTDGHVARVHDSMQQIVQLTRGGEENSRAILQSIHALDQLTSDNGQLVEQIASASVALSDSGSELSRRVADFKLG